MARVPKENTKGKTDTSENGHALPYVFHFPSSFALDLNPKRDIIAELAPARHATENDRRPRNGISQLGQDLTHERHEAASGLVILEWCSRLEEAMRALDPNQKGEYQEARERVPLLVEKESNPIKYLKHARFNFHAAASRLACYWKKRKEIFGPERAFRALTDFSGNGALTENDLILARDGSGVYLPYDRLGRTVTMTSLDRVLNKSRESVLRSAFLHGEMISRNEMSCTEGYMSIINARIDIPTTFLELLTLVHNVFPATCTKIIVINNTTTEPDIFQIIWRLGWLDTPLPAIEFCSEPANIIQHLSDNGFSKDTLPIELGGSIPFEQLNQWRRMLLEMTEEEDKNSSQEMILDDCRALFGCALNQIPDSHKLGYSSALQQVGDARVQRLTPLLLSFFRAEDFHGLRAATRVTAFWQLKTELFPTEKILKPVDQSGENALDRKDLTTLKSGFVSLLPNDRDGRAVVCIDMARFPVESRRDERNRCIFYMFTVACENEATTLEGVVVLCVMDSDGSADLDYLDLLSRISESLPLRISDLHLIWPGARPKQRVNTRSKEFQFVRRLVVHDRVVSRDSLVGSLSNYGLAANSLPPRLGGSWGMEKYGQWREMRTRLEWGIPAGYCGKHIDCGHTFNFPSSDDINLIEGDKRERKRRTAAVHARRKYDKEGLPKILKKEACLLKADDIHRHMQPRNNDNST